MSVFKPGSNTFWRVIAFLLVFVPVALVALALVWARTPYFQDQAFPVTQPVQFDHRHHVYDDGIDCRYCHHTVEKSNTAGIPPVETCMGCHEQIWNKSPLLEPVRQAYFQGLPIEWKRVHRLPDFVYFNHAAHVSKGVGCVSCHGRVDDMPVIYQVAPLTMGWCLDCHRNPAPNLRPLEHITSTTWKPEGDPAEVGQQLMQRYDVKARVSCTTCHR